MTSFGYRSNPRYAIKECSSCGTLYTRDCICSKGNVEDKILVPKPPKNCARCTRCGYLVDGPNCQGCALLLQELEENMVTYSPDFQNTSEPSNASTNVVNAPREPYVVKQDNGSFVDSIIFGFNRAPDSPNQFHCFHCKDVLRAGEAYRGCSKGNIKDKILVPKPPKNCARCTMCGYLVDGPNCQGCALLRQELEENLVTHSPDFQNTSEPSNASTNIVNAPREPYVVKQDNENVLRDGEACKRCTCAKCGSGLGEGLFYICGNNQNSLNDSPSISETSSQSPSHINHCCYECGDPLDGIFCKRCTCMSCGKDTHIGYNCSPTVSVSSNPEPCNNQTIDELPQTFPSFHPTFHSEAEGPFNCDSTPTYVDESSNVFNPPPQPLVYPCEFCRNDAYYGHYCTPQAPFIYPEPCYNQDFNFPQNFQKFSTTISLL
nr:hypothetical protein [Tanacetum cinerariifolium]